MIVKGVALVAPSNLSDFYFGVGAVSVPIHCSNVIITNFALPFIHPHSQFTFTTLVPIVATKKINRWPLLILTRPAYLLVVGCKALRTHLVGCSYFFRN